MFLRGFIKKEVEDEQRRSPKDLKSYLDYSTAVENDNVEEWALAGIKEEAKPYKPQEAMEPVNHVLVSMLASNDSDIWIGLENGSS